MFYSNWQTLVIQVFNKPVDCGCFVRKLRHSQYDHLNKNVTNSWTSAVLYACNSAAYMPLFFLSHTYYINTLYYKSCGAALSPQS